MDIVSFDPRGVNLTSPPLACFRSEALAQLFQRDQEHLGLLYEARPLESTGASITKAELRWGLRLDGFDVALDRQCRAEGNKQILQHSSTAIAARDLKALMEAVGDKSLWYWGFSYGSILGTTFAVSRAVRFVGGWHAETGTRCRAGHVPRARRKNARRRSK